MAKRNSSNQDFTVNADGWDLSAGTTGRKLTVTGADITITGAGTNIYTFPSITSTLAIANDLPPSLLSVSADETIATGYSAIVVRSYTIATGKITTIGLNARFRIL